MARITAPWSRPLEGNHIVSVPPEQQKTYQGQYLLAGVDDKKSTPGNRFYANAWYAVTSDQVGIPPFRGAVYATGNEGSDFPTGRVLYGLVGTGEEGWVYDPATKLWVKDVPDVNIPGTGGMGNLPPGPGGAASGNPMDTAIEFTFADGIYWTAKTPAASAAVRDGNPHPGISIINPKDVEAAYAGQSPSDALGLDEYRQMGWTGLSKHFMGFNGATGEPAGQELGEAMDAAMKGDKGAQKALASVGVKPPGGQYRRGLVTTLEEELEMLFS